MDKDEKKQIEEMAKLLEKQCADTPYFTCKCYNCNECRARAIINAGYMQVANDEIVVKKSEYVVIPKQDWEDRAYIHAMENHLCQKCRDMIGEKFVAKEEVEYWKSRCKEIGDVASKETAREILQIIKDEYEYIECIGDLERIIAKKYGVELE